MFKVEWEYRDGIKIHRNKIGIPLYTVHKTYVIPSERELVLDGYAQERRPGRSHNVMLAVGNVMSHKQYIFCMPNTILYCL